MNSNEAYRFKKLKTTGLKSNLDNYLIHLSSLKKFLSEYE